MDHHQEARKSKNINASVTAHRVACDRKRFLLVFSSRRLLGFGRFLTPMMIRAWFARWEEELFELIKVSADDGGAVSAGRTN
jgi:hypothetical protein